MRQKRDLGSPKVLKDGWILHPDAIHVLLLEHPEVILTVRHVSPRVSTFEEAVSVPFFEKLAGVGWKDAVAVSRKLEVRRLDTCNAKADIGSKNNEAGNQAQRGIISKTSKSVDVLIPARPTRNADHKTHKQLHVCDLVYRSVHKFS